MLTRLHSSSRFNTGSSVTGLKTVPCTALRDAVNQISRHLDVFFVHELAQFITGAMLCVCLFVITSRCAIKTGERIELVLGTEASFHLC